MVLINEWLPNPVGKDSDPSAGSGRVGEFVEIFNNGKEPVNLTGWYLKTTTKIKFVLSGEIKPGGFLVFKKPELKLSLNNTEGQIYLYNSGGNLADQARFYGSAPEGKSYSRMANGNFLFSELTPGGVNKFLKQETLTANVYNYGVPINKIPGNWDFILMGLGVAAVLTGLIIFVIKSNENLSNLFFRRDEEVWR